MTVAASTWRALLASAAILVAGAASAQVTETPPAPPQPQPTELKAEEATTLTMLPPQPQWEYVRGGYGLGGTRIFDGATGKMRGEVDNSSRADIAIDPAGKYYYVADTIWTKSDRGTRQDFVAIYDTTQLKLQAEIPIPGHIIVGGFKTNFILSDDGSTAYVYNYDPASSVNMVDLVRRKFVRAIELPGCASLIPNPGVGFSALCSDGSLATVDTTAAKPKITHSAPFFSATADPIFSNSVYDKTKKRTIFISYSGLVYEATMGPAPSIAPPFSIQEAAGVPKGETRPLVVNWLPGGGALMAMHKLSGHVFVLMHKGEFWSHKEGGDEIWDLDLAQRKVVKRRPLKSPVNNIEVTQDAAPLIFVNDKEGTTYVLDAKTMEEKRKIEKTGQGMIYVADVGTPATAPLAEAAPKPTPSTITGG
ncbi:amine dehydrogenase large subunit [Sphingomonas bacterium]|uniref:amine dehydrogenase large subunit n=1 Tax=Sphingomonas bacterium TaxID=1895847 RepID=UPI0015773061|nr:amine dehydrogenase large subunit [Sphingomonas bacterium]